MSLVTFILIPSGSTSGSIAMPEDLTIRSRRIFSIHIGHIGNAQIVAASITNCIADTGATFTATLGTTVWLAAAGNIGRGTTIKLPYKGLRCSARGTTTIAVTQAVGVTNTVTVDYEKI